MYNIRVMNGRQQINGTEVDSLCEAEKWAKENLQGNSWHLEADAPDGETYYRASFGWLNEKTGEYA